MCRQETAHTAAIDDDPSLPGIPRTLSQVPPSTEQISSLTVPTYHTSTSLQRFNTCKSQSVATCCLGTPSPVTCSHHLAWPRRRQHPHPTSRQLCPFSAALLIRPCSSGKGACLSGSSYLRAARENSRGGTPMPSCQREVCAEGGGAGSAFDSLYAAPPRHLGIPCPLVPCRARGEIFLEMG